MNCSSKVEGLATFTGRIGASIDRALVYFKVGQDRIRFHRFRNEALQLPGDQHRGFGVNFANWNFTAMVHEMKLGVNYHF
jgi:hypothetical protein